MGLKSWVRKHGGRVASAVATGGASEAYRAVTGKADPVTAKNEELINKGLDYLGGSENKNSYGETPEEKARREQLERDRDADIEKSRAYRDKLLGEPAPLPRDAPQVTAPGHSAPTAHAATPGRISSTLDTGQVDEARQAQRAYQDQLKLVAEGKGAPSAAELAMRRGLASTVAQQYALAGGRGGYSTAALRAAGRNAAAISQEGVSRTAELQANEIAEARRQYGEALATGRQQDITIATAKGAQELDAARYNQAAELQVNLANAGFDNQAILHLSDQELQARLANAGFTLTQRQLDDVRLKVQRDQQLQAQAQTLNASIAAAGSAEERRARLQQLQMMADDAKRRGDAATEQMLATIIGYYVAGA